MAATEGAEWDAQAYDRLGSPMQSWGETIVSGLDLRGDETALDLGCGSGRLTELLAERLPRGRIIAVDRSANMLAQARERLAPVFGDWTGPWEFADPDTTRQRLEAVGFVNVSTGLVHRPVVLDNATEYRD